MKKNRAKSGQTLVLLLVLMAIAIIVVSAGVIVTIVNSTSSGKLDSGNMAWDVAESGVENALMRLLRDPAYVGETLPVGSGTATITVTDGGTPLITSVGKLGNFTRTIQVSTSYTNNVLSISSWKEIY